jgi:hypothetical protein
MTMSAQLSKTSFPFDEEKATEVAGCFLRLAKSRMNIMKLVKLVYLLDREAIRRRGLPVVGGAYFSMRNGPVTSELLDLINAGSLWNTDKIWERFISDRKNHEVALRANPGKEHLSEFELDLIAELFHEFAKADQWDLSRWCHEHCDEWVPLEEGAQPISIVELAKEVGREPDEVVENAIEQGFLARVLSK